MASFNSIKNIPSTAGRFIEFLVIYAGLPLVFYFNLVPIPKIAALLAVVLGITLWMWYDDSYDFKRLINKPATEGTPGRLSVRVAIVAAALLLLVWFTQREDMFAFPRGNPVTWAVVMILYPLLSALPQELMYREFFFYRYRNLFGNGTMRIAASTIAFSYLHIIYDNYWALGLSLAGGLLFAWNFHKNRSLYWVSLEHALYGCLVFTIGMGSFFYEAF